MDRTLFYKKVYNTDTEKDELDFLWSNMDKLSTAAIPAYYRVVGVDIMRPDLISYKIYQTVDYWWVICLINDLSNPLQDLQIGMLLKVPTKMDIYNFYRKYKVRTA